MAKNDIKTEAPAEQSVVVTNKRKTSKNSILAFLVCLLAALFIWIHASNTNRAEEQKRDEQLNDIVEAAGSGENQ